MENKEQEFAMIPLRQFNDMKENEKLFLNLANNRKQFFAFVETGRFDEPRRTYFIPLDIEVEHTLYEKIREMQEIYKRDYYREIRPLEETIKDLRDEVKKLRTKKWYQFIPFKEL